MGPVKKQMLHKSTSQISDIAKHSNVQMQDFFAKNLAMVLNDSAVFHLNCSATNNKTCYCIRKFILNGEDWKTLGNTDTENAIGNDYMFSKDQLDRARELLQILHEASKLKQEKCYNSSEKGDAKSIKELRGMIGLGNGRKRSKKYEDYVFEKRGKLREDYYLCEKAAQKLLGYSINFLYKKLRTNPEKSSRIGATSKIENASKGVRQLLSLQQLQEKVVNRLEHCCTRSCITTLVRQHFDKIVDWRKRLKGCGQRVAQEIVSEVLQTAESLDGPKSFCQNLIHWVTGCSFKKIRRVREHLKKDPKSLPEHGLKKYWKDKAQKQPSTALNSSNKDESGSIAQSESKLHLETDSFLYKTKVSRNVNNNNNRTPDYSVPITSTFHSNQLPGFTIHPSMPGSQPLLNAFCTSGVNSLHENSYVAQPAQNPSNSYQNSYVFLQNNENIKNHESVVAEQQVTSQAAGPPNLATSQQFQELANYENMSYIQYEQPADSLPAGLPTQLENVSEANQSAYFFATSNGNFYQDGQFSSGLTPYLVTPRQQPEANSDQNSNWNSHAPGQSFFLLSPAPVKRQTNNKDEENWPQMLPITPVQMVPGSYLVDGFPNAENDKEFQQLLIDSNRLLMPVGADSASKTNSDLSNQETANEKSATDGNSMQNCFPLTPVAFMQPQGNVISGWLSSQSVPSSSQPSTTEIDYSNALQTATSQGLGHNQMANIQLKTVMKDNVTDERQHEEIESTQEHEKPNESTDKSQGASVANRSKRFSRDRLGAINESPFLSVFTPSMIAGSSKEGYPPTEMRESLSMLMPVDAHFNSKSFFPFPPPNAGNQLTSVQQLQDVNSGVLKKVSDKNETFVAGQATATSQSVHRLQETISTKAHDRSLSSCSSLGNIPEDFLQSHDSLLKGLSNMSSLPVLNLPSATWSSDPVTVNVGIPEPGSQQARSDPLIAASATQCSSQTSAQPVTSTSYPTVVISASTARKIEQQSSGPTISLSHQRKKRKLTSSDGLKSKPKTLQKQIRFHIFTPNDFADGQVNVSQYKKPSEYVSRSVPDGSDVYPPKRSRKVVKQVEANESVLASGEKSKPAKINLSTSDETTANKSCAPAAVDYSDNRSDSLVTVAGIPPKESSTSPLPNIITMLPLQTPAAMKNVSPNFKIMVPPSTDSVPPSNATPLQLNTPMFWHSGTLMTPSGKLNSGFFCRVSPGQLSASEKSSSSTPQIFNFTNGLFFTSEPRHQSSKSSESSDSSKPEVAPMKRSEMTLNLTQKNSSDDTLQTPSKIPVVTPSDTYGNAKTTPDVPPAFYFPMGKPSPVKEGSNSVFPKISPSNEEPATTNKSNVTANVPSITVADVEMDKQNKGDFEEKERSIPAIVVDSPKKVKNRTPLLNVEVSKSTSFQERRSENSQPLVIGVEDGQTPSHSHPLLSPLETPSLTQIVTPTIATILPASSLTSPDKNFSRTLKVRPQSLAMGTVSQTPRSNTSALMPRTPSLFQLVSPSLGSASSSSVMFLCQQKNLYPIANASNLVSPFVPRPGTGNSTSLLKSALTKRPVFLFPPTTRAPTLEADRSPEKESVAADASRSLENPTPSLTVLSKSNTADASPEADVLNVSKDDVIVSNDPCLSESAR